MNFYFFSYKVGQDLHIGLYVHGMIYSYWSKGIMIETCASWMDRIHIYKFNRCFNIANLLRKFFNEHSDRFSLAVGFYFINFRRFLVEDG